MPFRKHLVGALQILAISAISNIALSEERTFVRELEYSVSDDDSRNSARAKALQQLRVELLEEIGVYIESYLDLKQIATTDQVLDFVREDIRITTAGIVKTEIAHEEFDGRTFLVRARMQIDPDEVARSVGNAVEARATGEENARIRALLEKSEADLEAQSAVIARLRGSVDAKTGELSSATARVMELEETLTTLNREISLQNERENTARGQIAKIRKRIGDSGRRAKSAGLIGMNKEEFLSIAGEPRDIRSNEILTCLNYGPLWVGFEGELLLWMVHRQTYAGCENQEKYRKLNIARD